MNSTCFYLFKGVFLDFLGFSCVVSWPRQRQQFVNLIYNPASQRLLSCSWDLNSNFTVWARRIKVESPAALKIDKSLSRNVVAYKIVIAPSKHYITPGVAVVLKLHCALLQFRAVQSLLTARAPSSLSLPPCYKKSIRFQIAEEHIWLILNGYSSCARSFWQWEVWWEQRGLGALRNVTSELILLRISSMPSDSGLSLQLTNDIDKIK